jgi:hypothetical protein
MSSSYLSFADMTMLQRLLVEVREPERQFSAETAQVRALVHALEGGMTLEADLRILLAEQVDLQRRLDLSERRWASEGDAAPHRQEHMLPSPEEEFNVASSIQPMAAASHGGASVIARNATSETARVHWVSSDMGSEGGGYWARSDTGEPFEAVHWVETTWTETEVLDHSSVGPER